jgi:threonine synthase
MYALHVTDGRVLSVTDEDALSAQLTFARREGIFCEPSAAVTLVAVAHAFDQGWIASEDSVVGIVTGSGLREPGVLSDLEPRRAAVIDEAELERLIDEKENFRSDAAASP